MRKTKVFLAILTASLLGVGITYALPTETRTQPASASQAITECPPPTSEGTYFERGIGKDGNVICGFQYNDECPYASAYSASDPECSKFKEQQEASINKEQGSTKSRINKPTNECEGK